MRIAKATAEKKGKIALAGEQVDELLGLLEAEHYVVELKRITPDDEAVAVTLKVTIPLQPSLFDGGSR